MSKQTQAIRNSIGHLAEDARALMTATANSAVERLGEARKNLATALKSGKKIAERAREKTVERAKTAVEVVRGHPYQDIGIALAVGAILGFFVARRCWRNGT